MSCNVQFPDAWYLCDEPEWLKKANSLCRALDLVLQLRSMAHDRKMHSLLCDMQTEERLQQAGWQDRVNQLSGQYTALMEAKKKLKTPEGKLEFKEPAIIESYQKWRADQEEVLPLSRIQHLQEDGL